MMKAFDVYAKMVMVIQESGDRVRIHEIKLSERRSGSNGEEDGEEKGLSLRLCVIGKVKARGVGEMMARVGGCGASVVTSSAGGEGEYCSSWILVTE